MTRGFQLLALSIASTLSVSARADFVSVLPTPVITSATSIAFQDSNVTAGTVGDGGAINFLDEWQFTLGGDLSVSSLAASLAFTNGPGGAILFGVSNLQVQLVGGALADTPLTSWQTVSSPASGLLETVALISPATLGAGDYTLEVRGLVTGPGSYAGSLIAQPVQVVPLPSTMPLFGAGLAAFMLAISRSRRRPVALAAT